MPVRRRLPTQLLSVPGYEEANVISKVDFDSLQKKGWALVDAQQHLFIGLLDKSPVTGYTYNHFKNRIVKAGNEISMPPARLREPGKV